MTCGQRKLCDVVEGRAAAHVNQALQRFLDANQIAYQIQMYEDAHGRDISRYYVNIRDLCCAQAVLPAIRDIQARERQAAA